MKKWSDVREEIVSISPEEKATIDMCAELMVKLTERRQELNLSQRQLALKSGLKQTAVVRLEKCNAIPRMDTFLKVANSLGLNLKLEKTSDAIRA